MVRIILSKEKLYQLYFIEKKTKIQCADYFETNIQVVNKNFKEFNWKFRTKLGHKVSLETRNKISIANKGRKYSTEINKKKGRPGHISTNKGKRKETDESIRMMSEKLKGRNKYNCESMRRMAEEYKKRTKLNSEHRRKQAESHYVKSSRKCRNYLKYLAKIKKCVTIDLLFFYAKYAGFRTKDIERSYYLLRKDFDFSKYFTSGGRMERLLELEYIIPFLKKNFSNCEIKEQFFMQCDNRRRFADLVVFENNKPFLVVETKTHFLRRSLKHLNQAIMYAKNLNTSFISITNGLKYYWYIYDGINVEKISEEAKVPSIIMESICSMPCQMP